MLANARSPRATRCVWTPAAARIMVIPARVASWFSSVRNSWLLPDRTACSASARTRAIAAFSASGPPAMSNVQSIVAACVA